MEATPALTCIVIAQDDVATIARSLQALGTQAQDSEVQVVVVVSGSAATAAAARSALPSAEVVELERPVLPGEARNVGLARARGTFVSFPGSHVVVRPRSLKARIAAHRNGNVMVTGTVINATLTWSGWAAYFLENSANLPGLPPGQLASVPAHCSYKREALESVGGFPDVRSGEDTQVNEALFARGHRAYREPSIELTHRNPCHTVSRFFRHQLIRGDGWARVMLESHQQRTLFGAAGLRHWLFGLLPGRLCLIAANVWRARDLRLAGRCLWASPLIASGAVLGWARAWLTVAAAVSGAGAPIGQTSRR